MIIALAGQFKQLSHMCTSKISGVFNGFKPKTSVMQVECSCQLSMDENQYTSTCIAYIHVDCFVLTDASHPVVLHHFHYCCCSKLRP